jgi:hypothetical protein
MSTIKTYQSRGNLGKLIITFKAKFQYTNFFVKKNLRVDLQSHGNL